MDMDIFHQPALFLLVAALIGYVLPLVSARVATLDLVVKYPEIEGIYTAVAAVITGLGAELVHAGTSDADFSWRVWAATAFTTLLSALIAQAQTWRGSRTAERLRAQGSRRDNMHTDRTPGL